MLGRTAALLLAASAANIACGAAFAQRTIWPVDSEHSIAAISLNSSRDSAPTLYPGIAKVAGFAKLDRGDLANSSFDFNVFPARQESRVLNPDGTFRVDSYADLSRYTLMMFQSKSAKVTSDGHLALTGDLTVTHVERASSAAWDPSYTGARWVTPQSEVRSQQVTFIVENPVPDLQKQQLTGYLRISARVAIPREDFPGLWTWIRNSVWPIVVEDESCEMPQITPGSLRDYKGPSCQGTLIENPLANPAPDRKRSTAAGMSLPQPVGDHITFLLQIQIHEPI